LAQALLARAHPPEPSPLVEVGLQMQLVLLDKLS